jgi:tetratricopeptide (TPR) repeat protein
VIVFMMQRRWYWLGALAAALALAWALRAGFDDRRIRSELAVARSDIEHGRLEPARGRLAKLAASRPGALGGAVDYWLGVSESAVGRSEAALRAFDRVPESFAFDTRGSCLEAQANLERGRLRAAERRLEKAIAWEGPDRERTRTLLIRVYQIEIRFEDVKTLLRARLADTEDPYHTLKELSNLDLGRLPYDGLESALEEAGRLCPGDDRVWLGKARLAIVHGQWDEAAGWLNKCGREDADRAVWKAWLDWARGADKPAEVQEALRRLDGAGGGLSLAERLAVRSWLREQAGDSPAEIQAIESWLRIEPKEPTALDRLATLAQEAGQFDRANELRRRKTEVDRALESYRATLMGGESPRAAADRFALGREAEATGRLVEARALYRWTLAAEPGHGPAGEALARLDRDLAERGKLEAALEQSLRRLVVSRPPARDGQPAVAGARPAFSDDAEAVGLRFVHDNGASPLHQLPEAFSGGVALLDYDGDGWLDVYCVQGGPLSPATPSGPSPAALASSFPGGDRLFHNRRDGTFEDATEVSGIARFPRGHGHGVTVGDYDNDGRPDLFVTRWHSYALYHNRGDGTFEDATQAASLGGDRDWPTSAAFADLDGDGDLDLYVCHYAAWEVDNPRVCRDPARNVYVNCNPLESESRPDHLFRNDSGRFVDVTAAAGIVDRNGRGLGVLAADLDDDGRVDLFVANDLTANFLWRNRGGMRFEEVGHDAGVAGNARGGYQAGMGVACGDLDGDGRIDLAVTNFFGESTTFYRNLGGGVFGDSTVPKGLAEASRRLLGFGIVFFDYDNDGRLDLATANGHIDDYRPNFPYFMPVQLLAGTGHGRLVDVSAKAGKPWNVPRMGRGLAAGDLDNDGRVDLLVLSQNQPLAYFHNRTQTGHFATFHLTGRPSNREGIGAKVSLTAGGRRRVVTREGGGSYQSASDLRIHFGLGDVDHIDEVEVAWPAGRVDRYRDLRADTGYTLKEGAGEAAPLTGYPR